MQPFSATELLTVWEQGVGQLLPQRALALLAAASRDMTLDSLAQLTIGQRDARLLTLRAWMFGPLLPGLSQCPQCGERVEITLDTRDFPAVDEGSRLEERSIALGDYNVRFRLPVCEDLIELALEFADTPAAHDRLLDRCLLAAEHKGAQVATADLPEFVIARAVEEMTREDPQADIQLELSCPACRHGWKSLFDIVSFFWSEINAWATRILREVHALASAYGWSETDILSMSASRRQVYLLMATS